MADNLAIVEESLQQIRRLALTLRPAMLEAFWAGGHTSPGSGNPDKPQRIYPDFATARSRYKLSPPQQVGEPFLMDYMAYHSLRRVEGGWSWNSGMFLFAAKTFLAELADFEPAIAAAAAGRRRVRVLLPALAEAGGVAEPARGRARLATHAAAQVTLFEREGFNGRSHVAQKQVNNFERFGFNDRASSILVQNQRWEVCDDANFGGRCVVLRPGRYPSLSSMGLLRFAIAAMISWINSPPAGPTHAPPRISPVRGFSTISREPSLRSAASSAG